LLSRRRHDTGMSTLDYWVYSIGLVLVTVSVLVA
jgi:hypothetical protein